MKFLGMGLAARLFVVSESGRLVKIPISRWWRVRSSGEPLSEYTGQNLKVVEVILEVDHRRIHRVSRVFTYRVAVDGAGRIDNESMMRRALESIARPRAPVSPADAIARLEEDANRLWEPTRAEWNMLAALLGVTVEDLLNAHWRPVEE